MLNTMTESRQKSAWCANAAREARDRQTLPASIQVLNLPWNLGRCNSAASVTCLRVSASRATLDGCIHSCRACQGPCQAVTYHGRSRRCEMFAACDLSDLRPSPVGDKRLVSVDLRPNATGRATLQDGTAANTAAVAASETSSSRVIMSSQVNTSFAPLRVAIAAFLVTEAKTWHGDTGKWVTNSQTNCTNGAGCAMPGWCASALRLMRSLPWAVDLLLLSDSKECFRVAALECPQLLHVPIAPELLQAVESCRERCPIHPRAASPHRCDQRYWQRMLRWQLFSQGVYDAILVTDLDVDLAPPRSHLGRISRHWARVLPRLVHSRIRLVGSPDAGSPLNGGSLLMLPDRHDSSFYRDGLAVLRTCTFSTRKGWQEAGAPSTSAGEGYRQSCERWHQMGLEGFVATGSSCAHMLQRHGFGRAHQVSIRGSRADSWRFIGASSDQGFLLYMAFVRHAVGAFPSETSPHQIIHYWGTRKPYARPHAMEWAARKPYLQLQCAYEYLRRLKLDIHTSSIPGDAAPAAGTAAGGTAAGTAAMNANSPCQRQLWNYRREIEALPNFGALPEWANCSRWTVARPPHADPHRRPPTACRYPAVLPMTAL